MSTNGLSTEAATWNDLYDAALRHRSNGGNKTSFLQEQGHPVEGIQVIARDIFDSPSQAVSSQANSEERTSYRDASFDWVQPKQAS